MHLDHQHEYFLHIFDRYLDLLQLESDSTRQYDLFEKLLQDVIDFSQIHFSYEELYMKKKSYPFNDLLLHIAEHEDFIRLVQVCHRKIDTLDVVAFMEIVKSWLSEHILRYDRHYVLWVAENPSSPSLSDILNDEESEVTEIMFSPVV